MSPLKKRTPIVYGIAGIVASILSPLIAITLGIIGLLVAYSAQKASGLSYKVELILNALAILAGLATYAIPAFL